MANGAAAEGLHPLYRLSRGLCGAVFGALYGCTVRGLEHVPERGRCIVAANHVSLWDPPMLAWAVSSRRIARFPGKAELFDKPLLGAFLRAHYCFPLRRGRGDPSALRWLVEVLEGEHCLGLFPEGTRSRGGPMKRPKPGVGYLAQRTGARAVPVRVRGSDRFPWGRGLDVRFGAPLRFGEGPRETPDREGHQAFADRVMAAVAAL